jgi:glycosyltransferase involved in cell wall biosynthesis
VRPVESFQPGVRHVTGTDHVRVSIGVPSLNYGPFLGACLESIRSQTHSNLEVLIADGGSTDESLEVVESFVAADSRFRLISTADTGQADAVQKAFLASSGDVFGFLNADDCLLRDDTVELAVSTLREHTNSAIVSFGGWYINPAGARLKPVSRRYDPRSGTEGLRRRTALLQPGTFWRRAVQERFPFRTEMSYAFDVWFFYQAFQAYGWIFRPEQVAGYRLHGGNKSAGVRSDRVLELAEFESFKYGAGSLRAWYLQRIAVAVGAAERLSRGGAGARRALYVAVNSLSAATAYRLPGI